VISNTLTSTSLSGYPLIHSGKVRDTYDLGDRLLMVATDRISAFDVIMPQGIPGKGRALTRLSVFWFGVTSHLSPNHLVSTDLSTLDALTEEERAVLDGRSMIVRKAKRIDFECVVRDYLAGSAWNEYRAHGTVAGLTLPKGLAESGRLPEPIFTPAVKNDHGHDENISVSKLCNRIGSDLARELERRSIEIFTAASQRARTRGIIIADTKFEFGFAGDELIVIDEMLTPDSSRFWDAEQYVPGGPQPSFDKQYLRDWLIDSGWNRELPAPDLPSEVIDGTMRRYQEAVERLTGQTLEAPMRTASDRERSLIT